MPKLRMSSHRLHIETGRWSKHRTTPLNERTCIYCNVIEDEFHFVLEWKLFTDIRNRYIPIVYRNHHTMYKLITQNNNENKILIQKAFEFSNSILIYMSWIKTPLLLVYY